MLCEMRVSSKAVIKLKNAELNPADWNFLISFWEVNSRQLKLELAKERKNGKAYNVGSWKKYKIIYDI
jgi:hypothetical protein